MPELLTKTLWKLFVERLKRAVKTPDCTVNCDFVRS